jgi:hypothetical protein
MLKIGSLGLVLSGILAASGAARGATATPGLVETVEGFEKLQVAADSAPVANLRLTSGHFECVLSSGRAALVKAGADVVGIFFEGSGTMEYLSADAIEAPVVTYVAKKSSSLKPEKTDKGVRLKDKFTKLLWIAAGSPIPELSGLAPRPLSASFQAHQEEFRRRRGTPRSFGFALQKFNAPTAPYLWVEMEGGADDLVYVRNGMENPFESLTVLRDRNTNEAKLKDALWSVTLSHQPTGWDRRDPPRPRFVLTDVDMEVTASDGKDVKLSVVETLIPLKDPQSVFRFDLDSTVYTSFGEHLVTRSEKVRKVTDEAGQSLGFYHERDELVIQLTHPAPPDKPVKVRFDIDGGFLVHPGGDSYWALGVWSWFPQPELCEQYYTFHSLVRVKKPFVPSATGRTIRRAVEGDENVLETREDNPIQFAVILAGDYTFKEEVRDGVTIRVATYALKNDRAVKQLTDLFSTIIQFYTGFLGPFPFPEFNIIEINDYGFGQAPPGMMFITKEAFNPLAGEENQLYSGGVNERFAHEIAHQYWGHVVKMPSDEEAWLSESFAEYSAALFLKAAKGDPTYKMLLGHWKGAARFTVDVAPIPLADRVVLWNDATTQYAIRTGLLYDKGPVLLASLHRQLGDEVFLTFLKSFQKSFRWKFGSTKKVEGLLQFMTKQDFGPFFEANYWGTAMPKD